MAKVIICSDFEAQENKVCHCFHCFPHLSAMKCWDWMLWSQVFQNWIVSQLFYSPLSSEGRQNENHSHWKQTKLITGITALSNSMKLWATPCRVTQDRQVMVESSDKVWSTEEGNGKPLQCSCLENPMNSMKCYFTQSQFNAFLPI